MGFDDVYNALLENEFFGGKPGILPDPNAEKVFFRDLNYLLGDLGTNAQIKFLRQAFDQGLKYICFLNIPRIDLLPYFNLVKPSDLKNITDRIQGPIFVGSDQIGTRTFDTDLIVLPTSEIDSLLGSRVNMGLKKGITRENPLSNSSFSSRRDMKRITKEFNDQTAAFGRIFNAPVVDLYSIYNQIFMGNYTTLDGIKANPENFFSSDGIYPTAFGQVIIANEVIKALNSHYKLEIEYIPTRNYLN